MTSSTSQPSLTIWTLLVLYHELDDAITKLENATLEFQAERTNIFMFQAAVCHLRICSFRMETALESYLVPETPFP